MDDDNTPRFSPEDRIPDVPANDPIPPGELMDARYFLSGWTLKRYTSRFRRESKEEGETECADDEGDGVTPVGPGAFGWTPEGPPGRRAGRRRPHGVLTIPTRATVGQVRYTTLLAFCLFQGSSDQTLPRPLQALRDLAAANVLAAPAVDAATGEYAGWISVGSLLQQILRGMYPALLDPEFVSQAG